MKKELTSAESKSILEILKARFQKKMDRHKGLEWSKIQSKLEANSDKLWSLNEMEKTGGEPDVISYEKKQRSTFLSIVQQKVPKVSEVFATIMKHRNQEKNTNQKTMLLIWPTPWV